MTLPTARWRHHVTGRGQLLSTPGVLRLQNDPTTATTYSNAQIDDYQGLARRDFIWQPPLTLTVTARFSHGADALRGTAGFGFWNDPFGMTGARITTTMLNSLRSLDRQTGLVTMCVGGGQGMAMIIERMS